MFKISPSILSADFTNLYRDISGAVEGGADYIHIDVMDGHFVPNLSIGVPVVKSIRRAFSVPLDVHLMIEHPEKYVKPFLDAGSDILTIHLEAQNALGIVKTLELIRASGARAGLSVKPATSVEEVRPYLPLCDLILVMTVEPGFGGQSFIPSSLQKITDMRRLIEEVNPACELEIDGGIDEFNLFETLIAGADVIVMGSAVFKEGSDPADRVKKLRAIGSYK